MSYYVRSTETGEVISSWSEVGLALTELKELNQGLSNDDFMYYMDYEEWGGVPVASPMTASVAVSMDEVDYFGMEEAIRHYAQKLSRFLLSRVAEYLPVAMELRFSITPLDDGGITIECGVFGVETYESCKKGEKNG